jgi:hypothetical protein
MMVKIQIIDNDYTEITQRADSDDKWDRDNTYTSHDIQGIKKANIGYDLDTEFDVYPDIDYYLVYAIYDTGDSFGSDEGQIQFIFLYLDEKHAKKAVKDLLKEPKSNKYEDLYSRIIITQYGKKLKVGISWEGYFETLTEVTYKKVRLINKE